MVQGDDLGGAPGAAAVDCGTPVWVHSSSAVDADLGSGVRRSCHHHHGPSLWSLPNIQQSSKVGSDSDLHALVRDAPDHGRAVCAGRMAAPVCVLHSR